MIAFRNRIASEPDVTLKVYDNTEGVDAGIIPFGDGSAHYTDVMETQALRQALDGGGSMRREKHEGCF